MLNCIAVLEIKEKEQTKTEIEWTAHAQQWALDIRSKCGCALLLLD